jgi:hypothetical protein
MKTALIQHVARAEPVTLPETPASRVARHRARAGADGMVRVEITVPAPAAPFVRFVGRVLRSGPIALQIRLLRFLLILRDALERDSSTPRLTTTRKGPPHAETRR